MVEDNENRRNASNNQTPETVCICNTCLVELATHYHCCECGDYDLCFTCYYRFGHHHRMRIIGPNGPTQQEIQERRNNQQQGCCCVTRGLFGYRGTTVSRPRRFIVPQLNDFAYALRTATTPDQRAEIKRKLKSNPTFMMLLCQYRQRRLQEMRCIAEAEAHLEVPEADIQLGSYASAMSEDEDEDEDMSTSQGQDLIYTCNNCGVVLANHYRCSHCGDFYLCFTCYYNIGHHHEMTMVQLERFFDEDVAESDSQEQILNQPNNHQQNVQINQQAAGAEVDMTASVEEVECVNTVDFSQVFITPHEQQQQQEQVILDDNDQQNQQAFEDQQAQVMVDVEASYPIGFPLEIPSPPPPSPPEQQQQQRQLQLRHTRPYPNPHLAYPRANRF